MIDQFTTIDDVIRFDDAKNLKHNPIFESCIRLHIRMDAAETLSAGMPLPNKIYRADEYVD